MVASVGGHVFSPGEEGNRRSFWRHVAALAAHAFDVPVAFAHIGNVSIRAVREESGTTPSTADLRVLCQRLRPIDTVVVVEDIAADDRFARADTAVRFVAAAPIIDLQQQQVGLLCLADVEPRAFSEEERAHLRTLAGLAGAHLHTQADGLGLPLERIMQQVEDLGIVVTDPTGHITWINNGFVQLCGYTLDELRGRRPQDVLQGPMTDQETVDAMRAHIQAEERFSAEVVNYRKSGEPYWVHIEAEPIREHSGEVKGFIAFETDVTEQRAHGKGALQKREEHIRVGEILHDVVASPLVGTALMVQGLQKRYGQGGAVTAEDLHFIAKQIREAAHQVQGASYQLLSGHAGFPDEA